MKRLVFLFVAVFAITASKAQDFTVGADVVSRYIWRGSDYGNSPAIQPTIEFSTGGLTIGAWGSYATNNGFAATDAFTEADLYASYGFDFGLSLGVTDYYYPGSEYFEYGDTISSHAFEINAGYEIGSFSISANYILNDASQGAGSIGGDLYFEAGYTIKNVDIFVGAGDGWHTSDNDFAVCNVGLTVSKEIKLSDTFTLPVFGSLILNPETEQMNTVLGFSF